MFGACTSIIAENADGSIYHARNLDFGIWPALYLKDGNFWELTHVLRPIVVNVEFKRGGDLVYKSTTFAGFVGAHTAMRSVEPLPLHSTTALPPWGLHI